MKGMKPITGLIVFSLVSLTIFQTSVRAQIDPEQTDVLPEGYIESPGNRLQASGLIESIVFTARTPDSAFRIIDVPEGGGDVDIFARDCCVRDDIVDIYADGCFVASINSIGGEWGTHPGETHTVSLDAGQHTVEYRNIQSGVGPSGWEISQTVNTYTGNFLCGTCIPEGGGSPTTAQIWDFDTCGPVGTKLVDWNHFAESTALVAENGDTLSIRCESVSPSLLAFVFYVTSQSGSETAIGMCPFEGGCNRAWYSYVNNNNDDTPDCFARTRWLSRDYHKNDDVEGNLWTEESEASEALDWADIITDIGRLRTDKLVHKFEYVIAPPLPVDHCKNPAATAEGAWLDSYHVDPTIWPTSATIALAGVTGQETVPEDAPMETSPFLFCDLNEDGKCDNVDELILIAAMGQCRGDERYVFSADIDGDGCVATNDHDILTSQLNQPPECSQAGPSIDTIWPPNHQFVAVNVLGVFDPDGDPVSITIDSIFQDEPVDTLGDGKFVPDGQGLGTETAEVRAERSGTPSVPGTGRVYHISYTADDGQGGSCSGDVVVGVPHDQSASPVDDGALFDSTVP